jgi:hypothetical protein
MKKESGSGLSLTGVLFIIFLILKLTNNIDWSWWWVTSPLWIPLGLGLSIVVLVFVIIIVALLLGVSLEDIMSKIKIKK